LLEEAVSSILEACQENEEFKNEMITSITGNKDNIELSDSELETVSGGGWGSRIAKKVVKYARQYYSSRR